MYRHELSDFNLLMDHLYLPLPNGLIGLGNGWYAIKDTQYNHIAARFTPNPSIDFIDRALQSDTPGRWQFHVIQANADQALDIANQINIHPILYYQR